MSTHPFDIPEILDLIGKSLSYKDQVNCLRVSKAFYGVFISDVWRTISVEPKSRNYVSRNHIYPSGWALERNKEHIQVIEFQGEYPQEYFWLRGCRRLQTLIIRPPTTCIHLRIDLQATWEKNIFIAFANLISAHASTVRNVTIDFYMDLMAYPPRELWTALNKCPILNQLHLTTLVVLGEHMSTLLQVCSKAQSLILEFVIIQDWTSESDEIHADHCRPRNVKIIRAADGVDYKGSNSQNQAKIIRYFHNLQSLEYRIKDDSLHSREPGVSAIDFIKTLTQDPWLLCKLEDLNIKSAQVQDEIMAGFLDKIRNLKSLNVSDTPFGPMSLQALFNENTSTLVTFGPANCQRRREVWESIAILDLGNCRNVTGGMIQRVLENCSGLTQLLAGKITTIDIARGKDWACRNMTTMKIYLATERSVRRGKGGDNSECSRQQRIAYSRLATLTKLRVLSLTEGNIHEIGIMKTLDLRLAAGLRMLSMLKELRELTFLRDSYQRMGVVEARWITKSWPHFSSLAGIANSRQITRVAFNDILNSKNIKVKYRT